MLEAAYTQSKFLTFFYQTSKTQACIRMPLKAQGLIAHTGFNNKNYYYYHHNFLIRDKGVSITYHPTSTHIYYILYTIYYIYNTVYKNLSLVIFTTAIIVNIA